MIGHFVTVCGCEQYKQVDYPPARQYKMPTRYTVPRDESRPFSTPRTEISFRLFELTYITGALAEYREVFQ